MFQAQFPHETQLLDLTHVLAFPPLYLDSQIYVKWVDSVASLKKQVCMWAWNHPHMWALWVRRGASERVRFFKHTGLWFLKEQKAESITSCRITFCWRPSDATSENNQISVLFSACKWLCETLEGNSPLKRREKKTKQNKKMEIEIMRKNKDGELWECFELLIAFVFVKMNLSKNLEVA